MKRKPLYSGRASFDVVSARGGHFEVAIDHDRILAVLAPKALQNKSGRTTALSGGVAIKKLR